MLNNITGDYEMYEHTEKTTKKIIDNINDMAMPKRKVIAKDYLKDGKSMVNINIPVGEDDVGKNLGKFMDKQVKEVKQSSKKVKVEVE
jgi:hypothetical protein